MPQTRMMVIREIQPGTIKSNVLRQEVRNGLDRTLTFMRQAFKETVRTWETQVDWDEKQSTAGGMAYAEITTENDLYYLINTGAREHEITAKNYPSLVWRRDYSPKTTPDSIYSSRSFHGGDYVREVSVTHPGFEPRNFEGQIEELVRPFFREEMQDALNNFARKSGNSLYD